MAFRERFPTIDDLLGASAEDFGAELVLHLRDRRPQRIHVVGVFNDLVHVCDLKGHLTPDIQERLLVVIAEAISWAKRSLLLIEDLGQAPTPGWLTLSRAGAQFSRDQLNQIRLRELLPDFMLHPAIRRTCLDIFNTGHYEAAVFEAFKTVEIAVREAAGFPESEHGRPMVAKAFHHTSGPLADQGDSFQEREALMLFASGGVGYFKNPRSHRRADVNDAQEAAEMLIVASHILRIVDGRRASGT